MSSTDHKYDILSKTSSLKGTGIFINEYLILQDQAELRKEVQKIKESRNEGKWEIIRNRKVVIRDRNQKDGNKYQFNMLWILSCNYRGFPWNKVPKLSWISNEVDIILLVETWEHEESKVPNIDGLVLGLIWSKRSYYREFGCITCYIKKNIVPHIKLHKKDPLHRYMWMYISNIKDKSN